MVWNIWNDLDLDFAKEVSLDRRIPFLDMTSLQDRVLLAKFPEDEKKSNPAIYDSVNFVKKLPKERARLIKTHLCYEMLPEQVRTKKPKIIYVTRNPRDAVVSYFNHWKVLDGFRTDSFDVFFDAFLDGVCGYYT